MSWVGFEPPTQVFLGMHTVALDGGHGLQRSELSDRSDALTAALGGVQRSYWRRPPVRVWLGGGLCQAFLLETPSGLRDENEVRRLAAGLAPERTGLTGPCDAWVEDGAGGVPRVAAAVNSSTLQRVRDGAAAAGVRVLSIAPWWRAAQQALAASLRDDQRGLMAIEDGESLTLLCSETSGYVSAATWLPALDSASTGALRRRLLVGVEVTPAHQLNVRLDFDGECAAVPEGSFAFSRWTRVSA